MCTCSNVWPLWPGVAGDPGAKGRATDRPTLLMLQILTHDILLVFAMLALGFVLGRTGTANNDEARAANRMGFLIFQPALIFPLIAGLDTASFDFGALLI